MSSRGMIGIVCIVGALMTAGCGSDSKSSSSSSTTAETATTLRPATTTSTTQPAGPVDVSVADFPDSPVSAAIDKTYAAAGASFDAEKFAIRAGAATASWYRVGESWAVYFRGATKDQLSGKCPGTSIKTTNGSEDASNSPYGALACQGFTGKVLAPGSLHVCADEYLVYTSEVPIDAEGTLIASLDQVLYDGSVQGITGEVAADATAAPEIDVSNCQVVS